MDEGEEDWEDYSGEKDQDAAKLVDHEVAEAECGDHHDGGMILLQRFHLHLQRFTLLVGSRYYSHGDHPQHHFARVEKADEGEDEKCRDEVVGLVVEQVVHHSVSPLVRLAD